MKFIRYCFLSSFLMLSQAFSSPISPLSLDEYLSQVKGNNVGYIASNASILSSDLLSKKAFLLTLPNMFVDVNSGFVNQNQAITPIKYQTLETQNYSIGVEQNFSFGLNSKLYYNFNRNLYRGFANPAYPPINYQTNPVLQLDMPIWQGFLGSKIKANRDVIFYGKQSEKFNSIANSRQFLVDAQKSYWQLVASRQIVEISSKSLKQSERLLQGAIKKYRMNLCEESDVLQARADAENKKLKLKQAENSARIAARNFNQKRFIDSDIVEEELNKIDFTKLETLPIKTKMDGQMDGKMEDDRADVKAAKASSKSAIAIAKIEEESNKPQLDLYGRYGFNGSEYNRNDAINNSLVKNGEQGLIGVKFTMPLAIGLQSDIKQGARASADAARMNYRQKLFDQENDWQNLVQNINDYRENLQLNRKIENFQKLKLENERRLLNQGRTSIYQVLLFEQDYNQAKINTIQNAYQLLGFIADLGLYE